jgi:teichuronic acid biosynthesis glycosyltransferase TuaC
MSLKVVFVVPVSVSGNGVADKISPFIISQIESISNYLDDCKILYLQSGIHPIVVISNFISLVNFRKNNNGFIVYCMYGSFHGFLTYMTLARWFPIACTFGGSDILGSSNTGILWRIKNSLTKFFSFWVAKRVIFNVVKSKELSKVLSIRTARPIRIVPNGVDLKVFYPHSNRDEIRSKFGWDKDEFVILFNLRRGDLKLEGVKNLPLAREVVSLINKVSCNKITIFFITNNSQSEVNDLMNGANCLLLTSHHEGSPNIVKEAMACNLPIVTVSCGDVFERISGVTNCYVSSTYNAEELANFVLLVMNSNSRSNGRDCLLEQGLDSDTVAKKLIDLFKSIN